MPNTPYIIRSWRGGISDEDTRGVEGSFKGGYAMDINKRRDSMSADFAMHTISGATVSSLVLFAVPAADGTTYCFSDNGAIYSIAGDSDDPVINHQITDTNGKIKGALEWQESSLTNYLYWATDTSIARKVLPGDDAWGDESVNYKTLLDPADWHTMANASGNLNIANVNFLATIDYSGNFDPAALNVRPGHKIKCLEERDDYVIIGSERKDKSEKGYIWAWITTALNWVQKKLIPVRGVNALVDAETMLLQGGSNGEIFSADFTNSEPINSVPDGGKANPGGVSVYNDLSIFGMFGTTDNVNPGLYAYGRRARSRTSALNYNYRLAKTVAGSTITEIGAVWTAHDSLFASWKTVDGSTTEYGVDMISSTTRADARYEGLEFDAGLPHIRKHFVSTKVQMEPLPSGTSLSVLYKTRGADSFRYAKLSDGSTTYSVADSVEAEFIVNDDGEVFELATEITSSGTDTPEIRAIITEVSVQDRK